MRSARILVLFAVFAFACEESTLPLPDVSGGKDIVESADSVVRTDYGVGRDINNYTDTGSGKNDVVDAVGGDMLIGPDDGQANVCPAGGTLLITEIMADPTKAEDTAGEWFELHNASNVDIDIVSWEIHSGDEKHVISASTAVIVPAGGYLALGRQTDESQNGGAQIGYAYQSILLSNSADDLSIWCGENMIDQVAWTAEWPGDAGHSVILDPSGLDGDNNDNPIWWCLAFNEFGLGDFGSPGVANISCGEHSCGDEIIQDWEQCDDGNSTTSDGCEPDCTTTPSNDRDSDTVPDATDNCPDFPNPNQEDLNTNGIGDACENGFCGNGVKDGDETCDDKNQIPGDGCSTTCTVEEFPAGCVIVTEFMFDPKAVSDTNGEWFEVFNTTASPIDIAGWYIKDDGSDSHQIMPESKSLVIEAGGYLLFGRNGDILANGGLALDYACKTTLGNTEDEINLEWHSNVIDRVAWKTSDGWPSAPGKSVQLDSAFLNAYDNDLAGHWCLSSEGNALLSGDFGTPKAANGTCE